jgi:hypothetical protein
MVERLGQTGQNQSGNIRAVVLGVIVVLLAVGAGIAIAVSEIRKQSAERREGIERFGRFVLSDGAIHVGGVAHTVTGDTHAEVIGSVHEGRRSTATRTLAGGVVAGPVGALVGQSAKKKTRSSSAILTIDGDDWAESSQVAATSYADAVRFAQAVNLAARTARRR